ncbi:primosomal protein [Caulobacter soli]|uniref:primosomal protein n=1 Tax=Caulobacter soli TaxID=2708539 RepID=UPI0013EC86EA|nr:primosomal protein [Caulobacter soli]
MPTDIDYDDQDGAEALDETNLTDDGEDIANFDELDDVLDVTQADGDADEDDEDLDFDDEDVDDIDDELEGERDDEGLDIEREPLSAIAGDDEDAVESVSDDDDSAADFESAELAEDDIEALGYAKES